MVLNLKSQLSIVSKMKFFKSWVRFSIGTSEEDVKLGSDRLEKMINEAKWLVQS